MLMAAFLNNAPIKLIEGIVNQAVGNEERYVQQILWMGMLYLVAQILRAGIYARMEYATEKLQRKVGMQLQQELFRKLLSAEILDLKKLTSSELNNLLIEDVELVSGNSVLPIIKIVFSGISFLFALYFTLTINKIMPLIIIPLGLVTSLIVKSIENSSQQNGEQLKITSINMWKRFEEGIRGIFTLKLFSVTDEYEKVLEQGINQRNETMLQQSKLKSLSYFYLSSLFMITIGVILILSSLFVSEKSMTVGG